MANTAVPVLPPKNISTQRAGASAADRGQPRRPACRPRGTCPPPDVSRTSPGLADPDWPEQLHWLEAGNSVEVSLPVTLLFEPRVPTVRLDLDVMEIGVRETLLHERYEIPVSGRPAPPKSRQRPLNLPKTDDNEFPEKYFKDILDYIDMEIHEFWQIIDKHRSPHLWEKNGNEWKIKHTVY